MANIVPQFITDEKGKRVSVIIPIEFYTALIEAVEELEDIHLYDEVKARPLYLIAEEIGLDLGKGGTQQQSQGSTDG